MKILIKNSFVVVDGKELVPYYMNHTYDLDDATANKYIEKGYATKVKGSTPVKTEVAETKEKVAESKPKTTKTRKKKTEEK